MTNVYFTVEMVELKKNLFTIFYFLLEIKFSKGLRNITVPEGCDAHFKVEVVNDDVDYVCWEKNGELIYGDESKYHLTAVGRTFTLTIRSVSKQDEAAYCCKAGSAKTTARLYIEGKSLIKIFQLF